MSTYTDKGIKFTEIKNEGIQFPSGPLLVSGAYDTSLTEIRKLSNIFSTRAIDIDWGGISIDNTIIRTTGDLINWIKNSSSAPLIEYTGYYQKGIEIGKLTIGNQIITLYAPKSDGTGLATQTVSNRDEVGNNSREIPEEIIENASVGSKISYNKNINTSERISILFVEAESIKIVASSKIKLYEITYSGSNLSTKTLITISGMDVNKNTLYINTPKNPSVYKVEIGAGAIQLITSKKSNPNTTTKEVIFSVVNNVNDAIKYLVMGLFNFGDPSTLSSTPATIISYNALKEPVEEEVVEYKLKDGNIGLKFDNSDAIIDGIKNEMPKIVEDVDIYDGHHLGYHLEIESQVRAIFTTYNNCKIKAIHFPGSDPFMSHLWKVSKNKELHTYYGLYTEGYATFMDSDHVNLNWNHLDPNDFDAHLHDNYRYYSWYFDDGAEVVVLQHMGPKPGIWRNVFVEYEESNRVPTSGDHITYEREFTIDFRLKSTGTFSSETSTDKCIRVSGIPQIGYPKIKKNGSNSYLEITKSTPISISASRPNSKCVFPTEILSIEPLDYNGVRSDTANIESWEDLYGGKYGGNIINEEGEDLSSVSWKRNTGSMTITHKKDREGFNKLDFTGNGKIYGLKIKYRTTYANAELVTEIYPHYREFYINPSDRVTDDRLFLKASISITPDLNTTLNNNESLLNNIIIYNQNGDLMINPDLVNYVWFYDYNEAGYSMDGSVTPVYTKLGHLEKITHNGHKAVKVKWDKAIGMEVEFEDGLLEKWYDGFDLFVMILPPYLIYSTIDGTDYGNSKDVGFYYGFNDPSWYVDPWEQVNS